MIKKTLFLLCGTLLLVGNNAYAEPMNEQKSNIRFYLGGKIGYSGLFVDGIENLTIGIPHKKYDEFASTMGVGAMAGFSHKVLSNLSYRVELEYLYRLDTKERESNGYNYINGLTGVSASHIGNVEFGIESNTILANFYLDYNITKKIAVYAGFGLGMSILNAEMDAPQPAGVPESDILLNRPEPDSSVTRLNFAWQVGIGARYMVTNNIALDLNTRYIDLGAIPEFGNPALLRMKNRSTSAVEVLAGVSYVF